MLASKLFLPTLREDPAESTIISHKLMLRSGMIRQLASGVYNWLPLGLKSFHKFEAIVREEMNKIGGQELVMPCIQPAEIWQESGRWQDYGAELLRLKDRHEREFCLGPTHEEVVTDIIRKEVTSHKQLPLCLYQIHTKFRDEIRPRFGVMRCREFSMKDAYSFNLDEECLERSYQDMRQAYVNIFTRAGVNFKVVSADSGTIGGSRSEEFNVLASSGENALALSEGGEGSEGKEGFAANVELVPTIKSDKEAAAPTMEVELIDTPGIYTTAKLEEKLGLAAAQGVKIIIVHAQDYSEKSPKLVGLLIRGDRSLNSVKAESLEEVKTPLTMASRKEIRQATGCEAGSIGPVNSQIPLLGDYEIAQLSDFVCGANQQDKHYKGVNWGRDCELPKLADLRNITDGEMGPQGPIRITRGIEVGHIFQLGDKYSKSMNCYFTDEDENSSPILMGCYGIGMGRTIAASIEQNHDDKGIIWPREISPFDVIIIPLPLNDEQVLSKTQELYNGLLQAGIDPLFDDRDLRAGNKFNNCDLLGIPYRLVVSTKSLKENKVEIKARNQDTTELIDYKDALSIIREKLAAYSL